MKAAIRKAFVGPSSFSNDYPKPKFSAMKWSQKDEVLVKVDAAALNPVDYKLGRSLLGPIVGCDFCGTVQEVGKNVSNLKAGDIVYGVTYGSMAEYTVTHSSVVAKYSPPPSTANTENETTESSSTWELTELAALSVAYTSSLQCLKRGNIITDSPSNDISNNKDKSVLIIGASGGCGTAGIQLCKGVGVSRIVAICSSKNASMVKEMGATEVVDYTDEKELKTFFEENVGQIDCVLDAATSSGAGENYWKQSVPLLKETVGQYTTLMGSGSKWFLKFIGLEKSNQSLILAEINTADLELIFQILNKVNCRPLTQIMPFTEEGFLDGIKQLKSRRVKGKLVYPISQKP